MKLTDFTEWIKIHYDFDAYQNELFEASLNAVFAELENAKFNGEPFFDHYKGEEMYNEFFKEYIHRVKMLLNSIPESNSVMTLNIHGVNINKYLNQREELLSQISKMEISRK